MLVWGQGRVWAGQLEEHSGSELPHPGSRDHPDEGSDCRSRAGGSAGAEGAGAGVPIQALGLRQKEIASVEAGPRLSAVQV